MSVLHYLPDDPAGCRRLLDDLLCRNDELRQQAEAARRRIDELERVLAQTAADYRLEPWAYLRDVLLRLCAGETDLESLLPDRWAASHPEHVLPHRLDESRRKAAQQKATRERRRAQARKRE
jgi:hypothetical protein